MDINEYKLNKKHIDELDKIVETADNWFYELERITMREIPYDEELYRIYDNYLAALNEHMSTFLDVMKVTYDKIELVKDIFKKDEGLYEKINSSLKNIGNIFETYYYMIERIKMLKEEYGCEYIKFMARHVYSGYNEKSMKEKFDYVCPFHYELIDRMNEFAIEVAQPQIDIANAIYAHEMDFNKALDLTDFGEKNKV